MTFFAIVPFLIAVSCLSLEPQLFIDSESFVTSIADADPVVVNDLLAYARELINDGEEIRAGVIKARDDANLVAAQAASDLTAATGHLEQSLLIKQQAQETLDTKTTKLSESTTAMNEAAAHEVESQGKFDEAQRTMDTELARIATEDADLKYVQTLLEDLQPGLIQKSLGRMLLSLDEASVDPVALQNVINLVIQLIAQGELDKAAFTKARDDAQGVLSAAIEDHDNKKKVHTHFVGAVEIAGDILEEKTDIAVKASNAQTVAQATKTAKDSNAADAEAHRFSEENRIDAEKADFERVISLLESLSEESP